MAKKPKNTDSPENEENQGENGNGGAAAESSRRKLTRVTMWDAAGAVTKDMRQCARMLYEVLKSGETIYSVEMTEDTYPPEIDNAHRWFGKKQKLTNAIGGREPEEAAEIVQGIHENGLDGEWSERGGGEGGVPSMLSQAFLNALHAAGKTDYTLERVKEILREKGEEYRKGILGAKGDPRVKAEYEKLRLAKQAERANAAAKAAGEVSGELTLE